MSEKSTVGNENLRLKKIWVWRTRHLILFIHILVIFLFFGVLLPFLGVSNRVMAYIAIELLYLFLPYFASSYFLRWLLKKFVKITNNQITNLISSIVVFIFALLFLSMIRLPIDYTVLGIGVIFTSLTALLNHFIDGIAFRTINRAWIILILALLGLLFPKPSNYSSRSTYSLKKVACKCLGFNIAVSTFPDQGSSKQYCFGIPYSCTIR
jgi:hypothetical protein